MGPHKKKIRKTGRKTAGMAIIALAVLAVAAGLIAYNFIQSEPALAPAPVSGDSKSEPTVESQKLIGRWLRPDGGYVIEIRNINSGGTMEAGYFNPRPINVSRAEVSRKKGDLEVFIELQDTGYPGSTYTLIYNPQQDMFYGIYYQATLGQSFEVIFVRAKN
jgi:hypothetical protein